MNKLRRWLNRWIFEHLKISYDFDHAAHNRVMTLSDFRAYEERLRKFGYFAIMIEGKDGGVDRYLTGYYRDRKQAWREAADVLDRGIGI